MRYKVLNFLYIFAVQKKNMDNMKKILKAVAVASVGAIMMNSCIYVNYSDGRRNRVTASGEDTTLVFENIAATYDGIDISNNMIVKYTEDVSCITVTADKNLVPYIKIYLEDGELNLNERGIMMVNVPAAEVLVPVSSRPLESIDVSGASKFTSDIILEGDDLSIDLSGASRAEISVKVNELEAEASGASTLNIGGTADEAEFDCSGASSIHCDEFSARTARVDISGASKIGCLDSRSASGSVSGASHLSVKNGCNISKVSTSGASGISSK